MNRIKLFFISLIQALFQNPGETRLQRQILLFTSISIYFGGLWIWAQFFRYGNMLFQSGDWYKEHAFYSLIQTSLMEGRVPFHTSLEFHGTDRFLSLPELIFSPQILLLKFTENIGLFVLLHVLLLFTVGFLGCIALQRKLKLSTFAFLVFVSLFSFNGYITSHLAVGHTMWGGYFFLPWLFLVMMAMVEGRRSERNIALWLAMVLFLMWLQGSLHLLVGCSLYLAVFAVCNPRHIKVIVSGFLISFMLSFFRIIPTIVSFHDHRQVFESGIPTIRDLIDGLTIIKYPSLDMIGGINGALFWWELDFFIGVVGLIFVLYFGILRYLKEETLRSLFGTFVIPNLVLAVLAMNHFYYVLSKLPLPMASVERIPSRMMVIPLISVILIACVSFDKFCEKRKVPIAVHLIALAALAQTFLELLTHIRFWNVTSINASLPAGPALKIAIATIPTDGFYIAAFKYSFVVSAGAILVWLIALWWPDKHHEAG